MVIQDAEGGLDTTPDMTGSIIRVYGTVRLWAQASHAAMIKLDILIIVMVLDVLPTNDKMTLGNGSGTG